MAILFLLTIKRPVILHFHHGGYSIYVNLKMRITSIKLLVYEQRKY